MGLGKTLTVLSLILTNFWDGKPLAKPIPGQRRKLERGTLRYMPMSKIFDDPLEGEGLDVGAGVRKGRKDTKTKAKNSKRRRFNDSNGYVITGPSATANNEADAFDDLELPADASGERDEFDDMLGDDKNDSLGARLGVDSTSDLFKPKKRMKFLDDLSDDEEYQNMTEEERNMKMRPKDFDQLDGAVTSASSDEENEQDMKEEDIETDMEELSPNDDDPDDPDFEVKDEEDEAEQANDEEPVSSTPITNGRVGGLKRKAPPFVNEDSNGVGRSMSPDDDFEIPDFESDDNDDNGAEEGAGSAKAVDGDMVAKKESAAVELTEEQRKNLIIPPRQPAKVGNRRRATLLVTPSSLISHWLGQIEEHVDKSVELSIFVHHGTNRAMLGKELEDYDIVLTTYGTLQAELNDNMPGALLRARWLRVVLDEGHYIKNNRAKTSKAAKNLDVKRKWIISGTPIQNNLMELWSLIHWLGEPNYGDKPYHHFKKDIEHPIKMGDTRGVLRLQMLIEAVCLRRTKNDKINGKPLVALPNKTVTVRELEFSQEERQVYDAFHNHARMIIEKYMRKGVNSLLKNYAHVFAVMMRLRQLCCHRDLLPMQWHNLDMNELLEMVAAEAARDGNEDDGSAEDDERAKQLAEQLRDMIRDGMSDECSICLSEFDHPVITPCAHVYCRPCIVQHIESNKPPVMCPLCRGPLLLKTLLEAAKDEDSEEGKDKFEDIVITLSSTKINAALKELEILRRTKPKEKTIIVSQFTSLLSIFQTLLQDEGYKWTRLDGTMSSRHRTSVIADFQSTADESPTVMLLSLRAGKLHYYRIEVFVNIFLMNFDFRRSRTQSERGQSFDLARSGLESEHGGAVFRSVPSPWTNSQRGDH